MNLHYSLILLTILFVLGGCVTPGDQIGTTLVRNSNSSPNNTSSIGSNKHSALLNGPLSSSAGNSLDRQAKNKALDAEFNALENGRPGTTITWQHSSKQKGEVTAFQPYQVGGSSCRRYTHVFIIDGKRKPATATACREVDGIWVPLS